MRDPERDYIARTIATVRNHKDADNCWPQWANAFADEIERLDAALEQAERERDEALSGNPVFSVDAVVAERDELAARLAKVPALVEALRDLTSAQSPSQAVHYNGAAKVTAGRAALAAFEEPCVPS